MMMPSSLGGSSGGSAKHQQQLIQSASMLPSSYNFLPPSLSNTQLDVSSLFRSPEPTFGAAPYTYNQLAAAAAAAAAMSQGMASHGSEVAVDEQREEVTGESNNKTDAAASTSSDTVTSSSNDELPVSPKTDRTAEKDNRELPSQENSADDATQSPTKTNNEDITYAASQTSDNAAVAGSAAELPQMDFSKWISDFFPMSPTAPALNLASLTQRMPSMLEQMQLMSQYFSPGTVEDSLRVLAALGGASGSTGTIQSTNNSPGSLLSLPFASSAGHSKDTYCEMCDKNFCNRYFLRTHKWKKHGIPMPGKNSPPDYMSSLASPTSSQNPPSDLPTTSTGMNLSPSEFLAALCGQNAVDAPQISPAKATLSLPVSSSQPTSVIVNCSSTSESPPAKRSKTEDEGNKASEDSSLNGARENAKTDEGTTAANAASHLPNTGDLMAMIARQAQENIFVPDAASFMRGEGVQMQQQSSPTDHSSSGKKACEMCGLEYESRALLQQHLVLNHPNILGSLLTSPFSLLNPLSTIQPQQQPQQQNIQSSDADRIRSSAIIPGVITPPINASRQPKKQYSTGKNYCDVCNKEVCNKYFLRTHMLKMHGIVIDEHKTIIANIDTLEKEKSGTIAFRCDICNTNVGQTRESLKHHKQEVHNVVSLPTARGSRGSISSTSGITSTSSLSQALRASTEQPAVQAEQMRCPFCDVRTPGIVLMQKHLSENHQMELNMETLERLVKGTFDIRTEPSVSSSNGSQAAAELQQQTTSGGEYSCTHCNEEFQDQIQFQLHMIRNHPLVIRSPEKSSNTAVVVQSPGAMCLQYGDYQSPSINTADWTDSESKATNEEVEDHDHAEVEQAHQATDTADAAHRTHTPVPEARELYDCPSSWCSRRYRDPTRLSKHVLTIHGWRLKLTPKKGSDKLHGVITPSRLLKWKKRYVCLFRDCKCRFWSRDDCHKHILVAHFQGSTDNNEVNTERDAAVVNGGTRNGNTEEFKELIGVEREKVVRGMENGSPRKNTHTPGSSRSDSGLMTEVYGQPSGNTTAHTVQTFLLREQPTSEPSTSSSTNSSSAVFNEVIAHLPVRNQAREMVGVNVELVPRRQQISPVLHM